MIHYSHAVYIANMKFSLAVLLISLSVQTQLLSQYFEISFTLVDEVSGEAVRDAHVFLENSTFGAVSDEQGRITLELPSEIREDLYISHLSYETKLIKYRVYSGMANFQEVALTPLAFEIPELVVVAKRTKKWKKQFAKFEKSFLGDDKIAKKCEIINPEVLRFSEDESGFTATAFDILHIYNPHLGYDIYYLLSSLVIDPNGSVEYAGRAMFVDRFDKSEGSEILSNRNDAFLRSPKYFFKSLIDDKLKEEMFVVEMEEYRNGQFEKLRDFDRSVCLNASADGSKYTLAFDGFLQVYNENSKSVRYVTGGVRPGGLESQRFSGSIQEEKSIEEYQISQLYKVSPYIILNRYGNVLNSKDIKEYGFWAQQKLAYSLPFDYGNEYFDDRSPEENVLTEDKLENQDSEDDNSGIDVWLKNLLYEKSDESRNINLANIRDNWEDGFAAPLIELLRLSNVQQLNNDIDILLSEKLATERKGDYFSWIQWLWNNPIDQASYYFDFKSELYKNIDPKFDLYFRERKESSVISLHEVLWGGVLQDGIPPLRNPEMLAAADANYLEDSNIVFGVYLNGEARAYPKRILAWHEFFTDEIGPYKIAGVYCTLCGTVIIYDMVHDGQYHELGTSGFLYRSNKLMYDKKTQSLWSTIDGSPVIGPLVDKGIELETYSVVTTTWGEWRNLHPDTHVLSLDTGYDRNYDEGEAYKDYYSNDNIMFPVPKSDERLLNKDEVLIVRVGDYKKDPLAISIKYLKRKKWYEGEIDGNNFIVIADQNGTARAYASTGVGFKSYKNGILKDDKGAECKITEDYIMTASGNRLQRLPSHNIFWFAWYNVYPQTRLVK